MIVVTTPNGNIGKHVLRQLVERGETVRVISHHPDRIPADLREKSEVIAGSLDDPDTLREGFTGAESVFWCVPQSHEWDDARFYYGRFSHAAATALRSLPNAPRVVAVSGGGYGFDDDGIISALGEMEDTLNETGVPTRHLRCGYFMDNLFWSLPTIKSQGAVFQPAPGDVPIPMVCTPDIAGKAVTYLTDRDWRDQRGVAVHGAADISFDAMCSELSGVLGTPVRYVAVPGEAMVESLRKIGAAEGFSRAYVRMFEAFAGGAYRREPRTPETTTPTTLREWAGRNLR